MFAALGLSGPKPKPSDIKVEVPKVEVVYPKVESAEVKPKLADC